MTDEEMAIGPGERARAVAAVEVLLRVLRKAMDCFPDDDLETIVVFLTVAAASAGSHLRDARLLETLDGGALPDHLHRPTSARSVAQSSGLARETVRRRVTALVSEGKLVRDEGGIRTMTDVISRDRNLEFVRYLVRELDGAAARLARFEV